MGAEMNERMEEFEGRTTDRLTDFGESFEKQLSSLTASFRVIKMMCAVLIVLSLVIAAEVFSQTF